MIVQRCNKHAEIFTFPVEVGSSGSCVCV
uniref:Uncharacterized protein n=1 Tax=Rhizophora mucronata TaxID=61149 RepID=A0A2P2PDQ3_RHIMU